SSGTARSAPTHRGTVGRGWPTSSAAGQASNGASPSRPTARYDTADKDDVTTSPLDPEGGEQVGVQVRLTGRDHFHHDQPAPTIKQTTQLDGNSSRDRGRSLFRGLTNSTAASRGPGEGLTPPGPSLVGRSARPGRSPASRGRPAPPRSSPARGWRASARPR